MKLWIERGFSRLPIAQRMIAAEPSLELYTNPGQTPAGAIPLEMPKVKSTKAAPLISKIAAAMNIDAFWPQNAARADLKSLPCEVHAAATPKIIALVDDKNAFMQWLGDDEYRPDQVEALGADGVEEQFEARRRQGRVTCVKPVIGVNGHGYWKLIEQGGYGFLDDPEPREIDAGVWINAMRLAEKNMPQRRMLVMDWLPGPEVSVDLLCWKGVPLIHAARTKIDANHQRIEGDHPVIPHARRLAERLSLHGPVSLQYRLDNEGRWRILEINPRPAGGSIHSEDAGFGIISCWARLIAGTIRPNDCLQVESKKVVRFVRKAEVVEEN